MYGKLENIIGREVDSKLLISLIIGLGMRHLWKASGNEGEMMVNEVIVEQLELNLARRV